MEVRIERKEKGMEIILEFEKREATILKDFSRFLKREGVLERGSLKELIEFVMEGIESESEEGGEEEV